MRRKSFQKRVSWHLIIALVLSLSLVLVPSSTAFAQSLGGYFSISYDVEFSKTQIEGSETFYVTVTATATCTSDLPVTPSEAEITGRVVAIHQESGARVTLNSSYTITIKPFPSQEGDTTQGTKTVSLQFPSGAKPGTYSVVGELIEAKVKAVIWIPVTDFLPSSKTMGSVTYMSDGGTSGGGGGGGGGGGTAGLTSLLGSMTQEGRITEDVTAESGDRKVTLFMPRNTIVKNRVGSLVTSIRIQEASERPALPIDSKVIGTVYDIQPSGATFDPPVTLSLRYDASQIPKGVLESNLVIATWDGSTNKWVSLESSVQTEGHTVSTKIGHLSIYTVMAHTQPANFTVSNLSVTPTEVNSGEALSISVIVTNVGDLTDNYEVSLKINDVIVQTKNIVLGGGGSQTVNFSVTPSTVGERTININGLVGTFKVKAPLAPVEPVPTPAAKPEPTPTPEPATTPVPEPESTPTLEPGPTPAHQIEPTTIPEPTTTNWPLIGGIAGGAIVVGLLIFFLVRRRAD